MEKYKGIIPALVTPFTKDGKINEKSLQKLVKLNLEKGVAGFYVGGSTAEAFLLSMEERKYILDIVASEAKGKAALLYHIGCISTNDAIELGKHAEKVGVDAISSIPPFYYKFSFEEIKDHYFSIINNVNLPMVVYNFPAFSGINLTTEKIKELIDDERIIGIKHTSMDLYQLQQIKQIGEKIVFNGHDEVFLGGLSMGADGGIGSTYNFMAEKFIKIYQLYNENKNKEAAQIQKDANEIINVLIKVGVLQGVKYALETMGIDCGICRKPFRALEEEDKYLLKTTINKYL